MRKFYLIAIGIIAFLTGLIIAGGIMAWLPVFTNNIPVKNNGIVLFVFGVVLLIGILFGYWCGVSERSYGI